MVQETNDDGMGKRERKGRQREERESDYLTYVKKEIPRTDAEKLTKLNHTKHQIK